MCHALKHLDASDIDLDAVRWLLRRCQRQLELVDQLADATVTLPGSVILGLIADASEA